MKKLVLVFFMLMISLNVYSADLKFFPDGTFNEISTKWFSDDLTLLDPVSLIDAKCNTVRFSCMESMTRSYVVKLSWTDGNGTLEVFTESFPNQGERRIAFHKKETVQKNKIEDFVKALEENDFYEKPATEVSSGRDGCEWLIETNINGAYKVVCRWTPKSGFMYELGNMLIDMSGERNRFEMHQTKNAWWNNTDESRTELFSKYDIVLRLGLSLVDGKTRAVLYCMNISPGEIRIPDYYLNLSMENRLKDDWFSLMDENGGFLKYKGLIFKPSEKTLEDNIRCLKAYEMLKFDIELSKILDNYDIEPSKKYILFYSGPLGDSTPIPITSPTAR